MEHTLRLPSQLPVNRFFVKIALFCAMLLAMLGAPSKASAQIMVLNNSDAKQFAVALTKTSGSQDKLNSLANALIKCLGNNKAVQVARLICYSGIDWAVAARVLWCASNGGSVKVYTFFWIPYWADRT